MNSIARPASDGSTHPSVPPTLMRSNRRGPLSGARRGPQQSPHAAGDLVKKPPFLTLFTKLTQALFKRVIGFTSRTLLQFKFMFYEALGRTNRATASPAKRRRARTSPALTNTPMSFYMPRATD